MTCKPRCLYHFAADVSHIVFYSERMDDELREVYYRILPAGPTLYPNNVRVARLGIVQGDIADQMQTPRYQRWSVANELPSEADGRIPVRPLDQSVFGHKLLARMLG